MAEQEESNLRTTHHASVIAVTAVTFAVTVYLNAEPTMQLSQLILMAYSASSLLSEHERRRWNLIYEESLIVRQQLERVPVSTLRHHFQPMDDFIASCDLFFEESAKLFPEESDNVNQAGPSEPPRKASHDKEENGDSRWLNRENVDYIRLVHRMGAQSIRITRLVIMMYRDRMPCAMLPSFFDFSTLPVLSEDVIRERQRKLAQANRVIQQLHQAPLPLLRRQREHFDRFIADCQQFFGRSRTLLSAALPGATQATSSESHG